MTAYARSGPKNKTIQQAAANALYYFSMASK